MKHEDLFGECSTPNCAGYARWMSITEANVLGNDAPRRCTDCCDIIASITSEMIDSGQSVAQIRQAVIDGKFKDIDYTHIRPHKGMLETYVHLVELLSGGNSNEENSD